MDDRYLFFVFFTFFSFFLASEKNALHRMFAWLDAAREDYIRSAVELKQYALEDLEGQDPHESHDEIEEEGPHDDDDPSVDWRVVGGKRKFRVRKRNPIHFLIHLFLYFFPSVHELKNLLFLFLSHQTCCSPQLQGEERPRSIDRHTLQLPDKQMMTCNSCNKKVGFLR